jgi:hypothetical protein
MRSASTFGLLLVLISSIAMAACSAPTATSSFKKEKDDGKQPDGQQTNGGFGNADNGDGDGNNIDPSLENQPSEVWGHGPTTLYRLDPTTKAVTIVGQFSGCTGEGVTDIALDAQSNLFATTENGLWSVDRKSAACTKIAGGTYPNSLSFVPKGTVDPNAEALVGYEGGTYVRIDPKSGAKTNIGSIGGGLESSGDIVSVKGGSTYLTVTGGACSQTDCLIEVNPTTGAMLKNWGSIGRFGVYGLAFWAGKVYAFDSSGELMEVSFDGGKLTTKLIPVPKNNTTMKLEFWGAGSTTSAPVGGVN